MAKKISGSVGKGGKNSSEDVRVIQQLLNVPIGKITPPHPLGVDGDVGFKTTGAIDKCGHSTREVK